jgi:hypothetical protein
MVLLVMFVSVVCIVLLPMAKYMTIELCALSHVLRFIIDPSVHFLFCSRTKSLPLCYLYIVI